MYNMRVILHSVHRVFGDKADVYIDAEELLIEYEQNGVRAEERFPLKQNNIEFVFDLNEAIQRLRDRVKGK